MTNAAPNWVRFEPNTNTPSDAPAYGTIQWDATEDKLWFYAGARGWIKAPDWLEELYREDMRLRPCGESDSILRHPRRKNRA